MKARSKGAAGAAGGDKSVFILITFLVIFVVAMAAIYGYVAYQDKYDKQYITLLGEERVLSQQITKYASQANEGIPTTFAQLKKSYERFQNSFDLLKNGDPSTGMPASPVAVLEPLSQVESEWARFDKNIKIILSHQQTVRNLRDTVQAINDSGAQLLALSDEVATLMAQRGGNPGQVYIASRQLMLAQRIISNVNLILAGGEGSVTAADRFGRDAALFGRVVQGMENGNHGLGIDRVTNPDVRAKLDAVNTLFAKISQEVSSILEHSPEMFQVSESVQEILDRSDKLLSAITNLETSYQSYISARTINSGMGDLFGLVALLLLIYLGIVLRREGMSRISEADTQRQASEEQNRRNQQAIMRLLDEMGDLADGDLTVNATVTEDITGAIADSVNFAIEELRTLVENVSRAVVQVTQATDEAKSLAQEMQSASERQAEDIGRTTESVNFMSESVNTVSRNAAESSAVAEQSLEFARKGGDSVRNAIAGMNAIRDQIQETSKRIKRLGESSQEIGEIVELISDITEQTNVLALNAAIQAAAAGEAGRGFSVVAEEVQRLAERSAQATRRIGAIVKTIQTDTQDTINAMETSTRGVVEGAVLSDTAGHALQDIESVSEELARLIQSISDATREQAEAAAQIADNMQQILQQTRQTADDSRQSAESVGQLTVLADELRVSVSGFTL